jgi:hypothetical protein
MRKMVDSGSFLPKEVDLSITQKRKDKRQKGKKRKEFS